MINSNLFNLNYNDDIVKKMRGFCARANSFLRKFDACSFEVKLILFQPFCTFYTFCAHVMSKVRVEYNNVFRLLLGYRKSCSTSEIFVTNNICNSVGRMQFFLMISLCGLTAAKMS